MYQPRLLSAIIAHSHSCPWYNNILAISPRTLSDNHGYSGIIQVFEEDALPAPVPLHFLEAEIGGHFGGSNHGFS